jgi:hypothetical protein
MADRVVTRKATIPNPMHFEGIGLCFWGRPGGGYTPIFRCPDKGEWYVSGAIPEGYRARQNLTTAYWVVQPTHYAEPQTTYTRGREVEFTPGGVPLPRRVINPT